MPVRSLLLRFLLVCAVAWLVAGPGWIVRAAAAPADPLASLRAGHPRLLITAESWSTVKGRAQADPQLNQLLASLVAEAQALLRRPPLEYRKTGRRLLAVSREIEDRVLLLASAWHLTGDERFVRRAEAEMLAACAFADWNPSHFLDTAEMTAALALGYDWLHGSLRPEARATIREAIIRLGLRPGIDPRKPHNRWQDNTNNWNQVCWGSLTLGALAVAEDEPALARDILSAARRGIVHGLSAYQPDGVYPEGPSYWSYGTSYQVLMIAALESALGEDWGLTASPGFLASAGALRQVQGPTGLFYNFADGGEHGEFEPALFWFARKTGDAGLLQDNAALLRRLGAAPHRLASALGSRFTPLAPIWWPEDGLKSQAPDLPLAWLGRGPNPIIAFRSSWTDPRALYLAAKGGRADGSHAHMDAGSFILESNGVRWASDLGSQNYESLESKKIDLWNRSQDSQRWQVFRLGNHGHGSLTIDGRLHRVNGHARFLRFSPGRPGNPAGEAVLDLSPVFAGQARLVRRGFRFAPSEGVIVHDELAGLAPGSRVRWAMITRTKVSLDGASATLRQDTETLRARISQPAGATFRVLPADPPKDGFNAPNPGASILYAEAVAAPDGTVAFTIEFVPGLQLPEKVPSLPPLESWGQPMVP